VSLLDSAFSAAGRIGRYFSVVTLLPTTALVLYVYVLICAGGGTDYFNLPGGLRTVADTPLTRLVWLLVLAVALSLLLHPLQFSLTQLLEGYWRATRLGLALTRTRVVAHRRRMRRLRGMQRKANVSWTGTMEWNAALAALSRNIPRGQLEAYLADEAATKALVSYPHRMGRIMPTRLGNILRRHEDLLGQQYGLRAITVFPHLTHVAQQSRRDAVSDEGEQMDLALRLCLAAAAATVATMLLLARTGPWVFFAVVPYTATYVAYRAACAAAEAWMQAVGVMIDLDRFALYEALHVGLPVNVTHERRRTGPAVCDTLEGLATVAIAYQHPPAKDTTPQSGAATEQTDTVATTLQAER
jgi:hypothetical protein